MSKKLCALGICALLLAIVFNILSNIGSSTAVHAATLPAVPAGLKSKFSLGLANQPGNVNWMTGSGAAWDTRYQYLAGGVNTPNNWKTWQWDQLPPGQFALDYMNESANNGYLPVFTWYQMLQSAPASGNSEPDKDYNNLNNSSTMNNYFADFKLLMDKAKTFGKTVIIHVEPDLWAFLQQRSTNPNNVTASVASSGYGDVVANYPNTVAGFARALVALRDKYAPNALLGYHISSWASTYGDLDTSTDPNFNVSGAAQQTANFYLQTGANFDLLFYDISDRDAALYSSWGNPYHWWDITNTTYPNFNRFNQFTLAVTTATNKRGILWQVPLGNTLYKSLNNTTNHWQDNRVQYYLSNGNQHLQDLANSGIMGIMFGAGDGNSTSYDDASGDGITNPAPVNGNNLTAIYPDDDGGYLRLQAQAYYSQGGLTLPSTAITTATPTATAAPTATATPIPTVAPTLVVSGTGLNGAYFSNKSLKGTPALQRVDANVNFSWGNVSPAPGISSTNFSVRWTGKVKSVSTGSYTFCTQSDDGARFWVNGKQLINNWNSTGTTEKCGNISLIQGQLYSVKIEYYAATGNATAKLLWQGPSIAKQVVPQAQLYPAS